MRADPARANGVQFIGMRFPGIDTVDPLAVHPQVRQTAFCMSPAVRAGIAQGRAELLGLDHPGIARHLRAIPPVDLAVAHLSLPDANGFCSAGLSSDFLPLVWAGAKRRVAHLNPRMPRTRGSVRAHVSALGDQALCTLPSYLADVVGTEHGIAELRELGLDARAVALIRIAAPEHRDALATQCGSPGCVRSGPRRSRLRQPRWRRQPSHPLGAGRCRAGRGAPSRR